MAQQKGIINLRGKTGDTVYTNGKNGNRARSTPTLTEKQKKQKGEQVQNARTPILNRLASAVNTAAKQFGGTLIAGSFYQNLHSAFRKEPSDHRVLLLQRIRQLDVNASYQFDHTLARPDTELKISAKAYTLEVGLRFPPFNYGDHNCYYLEFILMVWNKKDDECRTEMKYTPWLPVEENEALETTLKFERRADDTEWLLACRCVLGVNNAETPSFTSTRMRFLDAGAVSAASAKLLAQSIAEREAADKKIVKKAVKVKGGEPAVMRRKKG